MKAVNRVSSAQDRWNRIVTRYPDAKVGTRRDGNGLLAYRLEDGDGTPMTDFRPMVSWCEWELCALIDGEIVRAREKTEGGR